MNYKKNLNMSLEQSDDEEQKFDFKSFGDSNHASLFSIDSN